MNAAMRPLAVRARPIGSLAPVAATGALVVGIALGERRPWAGGLVVVGIAGFATAWFVRGRRRVTLALVAAVVLGTGLGARAAGARVWPVAGWPPSPVVLEGIVDDEPRGHPFATSIVIAAARIDGRPLRRTVAVRASGRESLRLRVVRLGDRVTVRGTLTSLDPADRVALAAGAAATLEEAEIVAFEPARAPHLLVGDRLRSRIERGASALPAADRALLLGFLLGDTNDVDAETRDAFRAAGLTHLLAVSGANVAFVLALAGPALRRLSMGGRAALGTAVVVVFAAATRFEPSVMRASALTLVVMLARLAGRELAPARALAFAVFALLVYEPQLLHSVGFRLSVAATAGIVVGSRRIAARLAGPTAVRDALAVTIAAELAVAPMLVVEFGSVPAVAPVANLLAVPAAEPLTIYGLVATVVADGLPPRLADALLWPCQVMLGWVRVVARTAEQVPLELDARGLAFAVVLVGLVLVGRRRTAGTLR